MELTVFDCVRLYYCTLTLISSVTLLERHVEEQHHEHEMGYVAQLWARRGA
jgi:hypothetical protein